MDTFSRAQATFDQHIHQNPYPGRGLVIGRSSDGGDWLMVYWIMGRSTNSQNRRFVATGSTMRTEAVDLSLVDDPSLIIYEAMLEAPPVYLVSNGDQTRTIYDALQDGSDFDTALGTREREPDAPHYTPRISGMLTFEPQPQVTLSILKANAVDPEFTDYCTYRPAVPVDGLGYGLTTYTGDGNPLPSFDGEPLLLPLKGSAEEVLEAYWEALNPENRVSLAVKRIPQAGGPGNILIRNRFGDAE